MTCVKSADKGKRSSAQGYDIVNGACSTIDVLPPVWCIINLFNPMVYVISGFRRSSYGISGLSIGISLSMKLALFLFGLAVVTWIFRTGYRLKT